jgi:hypothetical protein
MWNSLANELREIAWVASLIVGLSVCSVAVAVALAGIWV